jgi:hypothetical protein
MITIIEKSVSGLRTTGAWTNLAINQLRRLRPMESRNIYLVCIVLILVPYLQTTPLWQWTTDIKYIVEVCLIYVHTYTGKHEVNYFDKYIYTWIQERIMDHLPYRLNFDLDKNFITVWKSITKLVIFQSFVTKCCKMRII